MTKIFSLSTAIKADIVDAFCVLQKGFTDQFVYYDKQNRIRYMGLGRCIALSSLDDVDYDYGSVGGSSQQATGEKPSQSTGKKPSQAEADGSDRFVYQPAVFFSFNRFDAENPAAPDELSAAFPQLRFMLPEAVLIENDRGRLLQLNSLGPIYRGRIERFIRLCEEAPCVCRRKIPYRLKPDSYATWQASVGQALDAIHKGSVCKLVLSRRQRLAASMPFSSKDLLVNLIRGTQRGTVFLYRYADVFFCGCTPELLVRKRGDKITSMCLAGTCPASSDDEEKARLAARLLHDAKNRAEHDYVVRFVREVLSRVCYDVDVPTVPSVLPLTDVQHLYTPASARALDGVSLFSLMEDLHPTPATGGVPVGEAKMLIRRIEAYNRGFYNGCAGFVDGDGDGEFAVTLRSGIFDGKTGWVYAGCGIVDGSDPCEEYAETDLKLRTILSAFDDGTS